MNTFEYIAGRIGYELVAFGPIRGTEHESSDLPTWENKIIGLFRHMCENRQILEKH